MGGFRAEEDQKEGYWGGVGKGAAGFLENIPIVNWFVPDKWSEDQWPMPSRPPLGVEANQMMDRHAKAVSSYMNRFLTQQLDQVDQRFASLGRGTGGARDLATQRTIDESGYQVGNIGSQASMGMLTQLLNAQLARESMDEERMYRQAQINAGGQQGLSQNVQIAAALIPYL